MVSAVVLIAVVCAVIGTVTALALRSSLYDQLDRQLTGVAERAAGPAGDRGPHGGAVAPHGIRPPVVDPVPPRDRLLFVNGPGQPVGTIGAAVDDRGRIVRTAVSTQQRSTGGPPEVTAERLSDRQSAALRALPADDRPHSVRLPGLGEYRAQSVHTAGGTLIAGIPTTSAQDTLDTLIVAEVCVTAAGLIAAGLAGAALVTVALRPLRRVAATATRVSELPLHRGEVALHERVPPAEADPRTEVGQVGAALNRMLGHVGSALAARQESETRVRRFVADASHELRTPLASIRGYAELTRRGPEELGPDTRYALGRVESEAARMTGLVEDLLLLARLDAGRPLDTAETDLAPLVVDAVSDARVAGPGHRWRLHLPDGPVPVHGDAARLQQVLVNLLGNARAHTPAGTTVTARVSAAGPDGLAGTRADTAAGVGDLADAGGHAGADTDDPDDPADAGHVAGAAGLAGVGHVAQAGGLADAGRLAEVGGLVHAGGEAGARAAGVVGRWWVSVEVEDDGPGIPAELLPHVFERFARGDASRSRTAGSTGLGLAIVRAVAQAHGGRVSVRSRPGRTVFAVRLPAYPPPPAAGG
ncbi:histidine kinase [Streptomyces albus subsp. albus]|nr:histidine kinase [Streptomyces albus subsp. albus]